MIGPHDLAAALLALLLRADASAPPVPTPAASAVAAAPTPAPAASPAADDEGDDEDATPAATPEPEAPGSAVNPSHPSVPPSSTGNHPQQSPGPGPTPTPTPAPPPPPFTPPAPRITFTLPFPAEKGGGEASGAAGSLEYQREDFAVLTGGVQLHYKDIDLRAEEVSIDLQTKQLTALGNVVVDQGPTRLAGSAATFDLGTKLGTFKQASGAVQQGIYFSGDQVDKVAEDEYVITHGTFTSCEGESPSWSFRVDRGRIRLDDYAYTRDVSMRVHSLPVLWVPYMVWPTKRERSSGLLFPKFGNSNTRGRYLGLAWYQVLGRSADTTFYTDLFSKNYFGLGDELRYRPSDGTSGVVRGYAIDDPIYKKWRWKVSLDHDTHDLPWGLRGVVSYEDYSDFNYMRDFERGLYTSTISSVYSDAYLTGSWGNRSFNLMVDRRQTFLDANNLIQLEQLPEIEYHVRPTRIATSPIYYSIDTSANNFSVIKGSLDGSYDRFHLLPQIRAPLSPFTWLSLTVNGGEDLTYYNQAVGVDPTTFQQKFLDQTLTRALPFAGASLVGPSFSRIYNLGLGPFGKFKHIIEPNVTYSYEKLYDEQQKVPIFDEIDPVGGGNLGRVSIVNRILGKPTDTTKMGGAREIFSLEIGRRYSFDPSRPFERGTTPDLVSTHSAWGPWELSLRSYPTEKLGLRVDATYSALFTQLTGVQASGNVTFGKRQQMLSFTWTPSWQSTTGQELSNQGTIGGTLHAGPHLSVSSYVTYDFHLSLLRDQRHLITWAGSCYAIHLELHEFVSGIIKRRDYLFSVDLKNVGTFLDLNGGESSGL